MNLISKRKTPPIHSFTIFSKWMEACSHRGWTVIEDKFRANTFVAIDKDTNVVGMFVMSQQVWHGFVFDSHFDRILFEAGEGY
jgi:hypothetical protein